MLTTLAVRSIRRLLFCCLVFSTTCFSSAFARFPDRPIRLIVPFPPGGVTDILARDISQHLGTQWGQPVIVDNRGGANGNIGAEIAAKAKPDGLTLLIAPANIAISASLYKALPYDLFKDLAPVTQLATGPYILISSPSLPANTVAELIALARSKPGQVSMASSGTGSAGHLAGELMQSAAGVRFTHIPYKGQGPAIIDTIGGQVSIFFATVAVVNPHLADGKIKILAVTTNSRSALMPNVPTIAESGFPAFNVGAWHGAFLPAGTPAEIVQQYNAELVAYLSSPKLQKTYTQQGLQLITNTPPVFTQFLHGEVALYAQAIKKAHLQLQ